MKPTAPVMNTRNGIDIGRVVMVPTACAILVIDALSLGHTVGSRSVDALRSLGTVLVLAFYLVLIWCYLRRGPATSTSASLTAHAAAVIATWLPFALQQLHGPSPGHYRHAPSDFRLVSGGAWSACTHRLLPRNVSVRAQTRDHVERGTYRCVRHPLYAGELVSAIGVAI